MIASPSFSRFHIAKSFLLRIWKIKNPCRKISARDEYPIQYPRYHPFSDRKQSALFAYVRMRRFDYGGAARRLLLIVLQQDKVRSPSEAHSSGYICHAHTPAPLSERINPKYYSSSSVFCFPHHITCFFICQDLFVKKIKKLEMNE